MDGSHDKRVNKSNTVSRLESHIRSCESLQLDDGHEVLPADGVAFQ
jgi:hypothetical protein